MFNVKSAFTFLILAAGLNSYAEYSPACGQEYGKIKGSKPRQIISTQEFENGDDLNILNKLEQRALSKYMATMFPDAGTVFSIQLAKYVDKKDSKKTNGYRVRIDMLDSDEAQVSYYLTKKGTFLKSFWDNQSPVHTWICEGFVTDEARLIQDMADQFGEYFDFEGEELAKHLRPVSLKKLPARVRAFAKAEAEERTERMRWDDEHDEISDYVFVEDEHHAIVSKGKVIGYVISLHDSIDHPLWDGSGVFLYIEAKNLKIVDEVSWDG